MPKAHPMDDHERLALNLSVLHPNPQCLSEVQTLDVDPAVMELYHIISDK